MLLTYVIFLLFKMDFSYEMEYQQQAKTLRLKYIFFAGKMTRTVRSVVKKLSEDTSIKRYMKKVSPEKTTFLMSLSVIYN